MNLLKNGERGKGTFHVILLFFFLVIVTLSFFFILLDERQPKVVSLNMKELGENTVGSDLEPPVIKTELLKPEDDPVENTKPIAQFIAKTPVHVGERVTYEDQSYDKDLGGSIVNVHWEGKREFFTKPGAYTVTLRVQDDQAAWSEPISHVIMVLERPKEKYNNPPIAIFKATNPVYVGETVVYQDGSFDPDGDAIVNRQWEGKQNVFRSPGEHRVTLRVQDSQGKWSDPLFQYIVVKERPLVEVQRPPIALFDVTSPVYVGQTVTYTDKSFDQDPEDTIKNVDWSATKRSSYDKPGKYEVTLRVQDNHGDWSEPFTRVVEVLDSPNNPPFANFVTNSPIYINEPVTFENTSYDSDGIITREQWSGDKRYMYTQAGEYEVTLTVWDDDGARTSKTKKVVVLDAHNQAPVAAFHTNAPIYVGEKVYFWDDSYDEDDTITRREWSGDKREVYDNPGTYFVTLTVWDDLGETTSITKEIEVMPKENQIPIAKISGPTEIHVNQTVTFKDESYDPDGYIVSTNWGSQTLVKTWTTPGVYYIDLQVTDNRGETNLVEVPVYVREEGYPIGN